MSKYAKSLQFIEHLGIKYPIVQAPMAGTSTAKLASEVTLSGGLGSLALAPIDLRKGIDKVVELLQHYRQLISKDSSQGTSSRLKVHVNFFCHEVQKQPTERQISNWWSLYKAAVPELSQLADKIQAENGVSFANGNVSFKEVEQNHPEVIEELVAYWKAHPELLPKMASFHFGSPSTKTIQSLQSLGILVFVCATSPQEAEILIEKGVNGLLCQGYEAGGHRGNFLTTPQTDTKLSTLDLFLETTKLLQKRNRHDNIYLVPAGGIMSSQTITKYLSLGASAVLMGTVFLTCPETNSSSYIRSLLETRESKTPSQKSRDLPFTELVPLVSGKAARTIVTPFIANLLASYNSPDTFVDANGSETPQDSKVGEGLLPGYGHSYIAYKSLQSKYQGQLKEDIGFYLAGANYRQIRAGMPAGEVVRTLGEGLNVK